MHSSWAWGEKPSYTGLAQGIGMFKSDPQYPHKSWVWLYLPILQLCRQRQEDPGLQWPASIVESVSSRFIKRPCLKT